MIQNDTVYCYSCTHASTSSTVKQHNTLQLATVSSCCIFMSCNFIFMSCIFSAPCRPAGPYICILRRLTLRTISEHIVKPWVMIGSSSTPLPSQQSSSTHLQPASSAWRYISTDDLPVSWCPAVACTLYSHHSERTDTDRQTDRRSRAVQPSRCLLTAAVFLFNEIIL